MPAADVELLRHYDRLEPFGPPRLDMAAGIIASDVRRFFGQDEPPNATDYVLKFKLVEKPKPVEPQTPQEMEEVMKAFCHLTGGTVK